MGHTPPSLPESISNAASKEVAILSCQQESEPALSRDLDDYQIDKLKQELKEAKDTHDLRMKYANKIFILICFWLAFVAITMVLSGFGWWGFSLSEKVLITFITSTTISVLGLFIIVAKWMFPNNNKNSD